MNAADYRIESSQPIVASLARTRVVSGALVHDMDLAISIAAKSVTEPPGGVVRVVHIPSGEVVFSKVSGWGDLGSD